METSKEIGCRTPEGPILCVNNCGFFGSAATMNMCSKCHKDMILNQEQAKQATSSIENLINGGACSNGKEHVGTGPVDVKLVSIPSSASPHPFGSEVKAKEGPNRCSACRKRVGLTGFSCRCGNLFCSSHRYSDKHDCQYDYQTAGRDAISKANPIVKAEKLDKI
ncbi:zinc finger A20 and AN1 domain-containing stress-associated protein 8-like [Impatiens glandulifera]|uniref:zinc finger A20 and AN1 domain-containing stress-associated protein 8-like n=1 Tax=Impatiens glandulifera TaxID=253017 RepID=UPI001FB11784|nr:zinc finger A20 and AN1 domain-containing stress-associated protein 8-like [Impatiens glandulifera]XP_047334818.1 zinc finger A20 and AN1 domain-containing stress-associated protein 8-like [Impatiens glandulifera]XP_047334819.1 zinc finger A20 and AN1 domain-containing stress-associated protein 8-like [Impatiens glandulifera]XP_047334820.1 zinc finger A20 and AN1 domain-containing stress-associated protein 8-like [Impatiens glandulifera]